MKTLVLGTEQIYRQRRATQHRLSKYPSIREGWQARAVPSRPTLDGDVEVGSRSIPPRRPRSCRNPGGTRLPAAQDRPALTGCDCARKIGVSRIFRPEAG